MKRIIVTIAVLLVTGCAGVRIPHQPMPAQQEARAATERLLASDMKEAKMCFGGEPVYHDPTPFFELQQTSAAGDRIYDLSYYPKIVPTDEMRARRSEALQAFASELQKAGLTVLPSCTAADVRVTMDFGYSRGTSAGDIPLLTTMAQVRYAYLEGGVSHTFLLSPTYYFVGGIVSAKGETTNRDIIARKMGTGMAADFERLIRTARTQRTASK